MAELGGYGLIDVNALDMSIKASWISRWQREMDWRDYPSFYATGTNVGDIEQLSHIGIFIPDIIRDIMGKWDSFLKIYYAYEGNILEAPLFENRALSTDDRTNSINGIFSGERWRLIRNNWINIKVKNVLSEEWHLLEKVAIELMTNTHITYAEYFRLRTSIMDIALTYNSEVGIPMEITTYIQGIKKGSSKFRVMIDGVKSKMYKEARVINLPVVRTLLGQYLNEDDESLVRINMKLWKIGRLNSGFKQFLFKFVHGRLYLNNVLSHIDDTLPWCTICKLHLDRDPNVIGLDRVGQVYQNLLGNLPRETVEHLFVECRYVRPIILNIVNNRLRAGAFEDKVYMMGDNWTNSREGITVRCLIMHFIKYQVYLCRCLKRIPTQQLIDFELQRFIDELLKSKSWAPFVRQLRRL